MAARDDTKTRGIVKQIGTQRRLVLPKNIADLLRIKNYDLVEIYVEDDKLIVKKYNPDCVFCESDVDIEVVKGKRICKNCLEEMKNL